MSSHKKVVRREPQEKWLKRPSFKSQLIKNKSLKKFKYEKHSVRGAYHKPAWLRKLERQREKKELHANKRHIKKKKRILDIKRLLVNTEFQVEWHYDLLEAVFSTFGLTKDYYLRRYFRNHSFFYLTNYGSQYSISFEPVPVIPETLKYYNLILKGYSGRMKDFYKKSFGRGIITYFPESLIYYAELENRKIFKEVQPRKMFNRKKKINFLRNCFRCYNFLQKNGLISWRSLRIWEDTSPLYFKGSLVKKMYTSEKYHKFPVKYINFVLNEFDRTTGGACLNLLDLCTALDFIKEVINNFKKKYLACFIRQKIFFSHTTWREAVWILLGIKLKNLCCLLLVLYKKESAILNAYSGILLQFALHTEDEFQKPAQLEPYVFQQYGKNITDIFRLFLTQLDIYFRYCQKSLALPILYKRESLMAYKFLRRLGFLLTKRGGRFRAFKILTFLRKISSLNNRVKWKKPFRQAKMAEDVFVKILANLKTYFFLRKSTKGRKTIFIPGILYKNKKLKVSARWFMSAVKKKKSGRPVVEKLFENVRNVYYTQSVSKDLQRNYNLLVKSSKINIVPKRGARKWLPTKPKFKGNRQKRKNTRNAKGSKKLTFKKAVN